MNTAGHVKKAQEIYDDIVILKEHDGEAHVSSIVELVYECAEQPHVYGELQLGCPFVSSRIQYHLLLEMIVVTKDSTDISSTYSWRAFDGYFSDAAACRFQNCHHS